MKQKATNQEILLLTGTNFCGRQFSRSGNDNIDAKNNPAKEQIEKACWDGMVDEMLPELADNSSKGNRNFIWNVVIGINFLCVSTGPCPMPEKNATSIDPYYCLPATPTN